MTAERFLGLLACVVLLGAVAWGQQPQPRNFENDFRAAAKSMEGGRPADSVKALEKLLERYKEPEEVQRIQLARAECLRQMKQHDEAVNLLTTVRQQFKEDKPFQAGAMLLTGDVLRAKPSLPEAVATYQKLAADYADQPERAADALLRAGDVLCNDLKKYPEGLASYAAVEKQFAAQARQAAESVLKTAVVQETLTKDLAAAAAAYARLTDVHAAQYNEQVLAGYYAKQAECLRGAAKAPDALAALKKGEGAIKDNRLRTPLALAQADVLIEMKKFPEARGECERIICQYPLEADVCQASQGKVVEAYRSESKFAEGLGAARILYDAAGSEPQIRSAAHVVAQAFRSLDGNLARANEFLAFQRFGPPGADGKAGTPDDLATNHLAAVKYPSTDPARDKRFTDAIQAQPNTFEGYRAKGYLYVYWGKPKEGAQQFQLAFRACPDPQVPAAAQELVLVGMKAHTASFYGLDRIFEYISYGAKGKSGKENIPDPFQGF